MDTAARALAVLDALPEPWVLLQPERDADGTIVDFVYVEANVEACAFNHRTRADVVGQRLSTLHPQAIEFGLLESYRAIIETGEPMTMLDWEYGVDPLTGARRHFDLWATRVGDCVSQIWVDVTDRHRAQTGLTESEARYRLLAENASDVVFRGNNDGLVEWVSPQIERITGRHPADVVGRPFIDLVDPEDRSRIRGWQAALVAGNDRQGPVRVKHADGTTRWVLVTVKPVTGADGAVIGRVGSWVDIEEIMAARDAAERARARMQAILDAQIDPFILLSAVRDSDGSIIDLEYADANEAALSYNRATREELIGRRVLDLFPGQLENGPMRLYFHAIETGEPVILDDYMYPNEVLGQERRYDIRAFRYDGGIGLTWRDVTDRHRAAMALAESEHRYRLLAENATDVIWQVDTEGLLTWVSDSTVHLLGWTPSELIGHQSTDYVHPEDLAIATALRRRAREGQEGSGEIRFLCRDGTHLWMAVRVKPLRSGEDLGRIVVMHDMDAEVRARAALTRTLGRDQLTGLMNRSEFERTIARAATRSRMEELSVLCVGLDALSAINNAYTHHVGDVVLTTTAARIATETRDADGIARGDGADFFVLLTDDATGAQAAELAERIRVAARQPLKVGSHVVETTVSQGIAVGLPDSDPAELIRSSTVAMRAAKNAGRDRIEFATSALAADAEHLMTFTGVITEAMRNGEFTCWFQPVTDLLDAQLQGYESLARWIHPDGTVVTADTFMPITEHSRLVSDLDMTVLSDSLTALAHLPSPLFVSVNVSSRSLASAEHTRQILERIRHSGIDPTRLHLEVTETALLAATTSLVERMRVIADLGVRWYVDDFGTGYSSISHLRDLPIRGLKLDVSFTRGLGQGEANSIQLSQALAGLGHGLGLDTIAEGVETEAQRATLAAQGWRRGQGWLFGRAAPLHFTGGDS